jgi:RNA polymerase sigma-70 factor (ECF subfamily)
MTAASVPYRGPAIGGREHDVPPTALTFDAIYDEHARFVWRSVCRLGVLTDAADDAVQDIFLVVHRRLPEFEERTSVSAWLYAIVIRVVRQYRRTLRRKSPMQAPGMGAIDPDTLVDRRARSPLEEAERQDAVRTLYVVLEAMNDERREVFVLAELEQLTAPEMAAALDVNVNTIYWRLRVARQEFERVLEQQRRVESRSAR